MTKEDPKSKAPFVQIREMMAGIPMEIWPILLPRSVEQLPALDEAIGRLRERERARDEVMSIQKLCGLPLRPNASLKSTKTRARLQGIMRERMLNRYKRGRSVE